MSRDKLIDRANDDTDESDTDSSESGSGRMQLTQRMDEQLVKDLDAFAEENGMSRNAAINFACAELLRDRNYR